MMLQDRLVMVLVGGGNGVDGVTASRSIRHVDCYFSFVQTTPHRDAQQVVQTPLNRSNYKSNVPSHTTKSLS